MSGQALTATDLIASYAALVATAALALEIRRWFDSRPKFAISVEAPWRLSSHTHQKYVRATVSNRWDKAFSIEYFALMEFRSLWHRVILGKNCWNALVWIPNQEKPLPHYLNPGELWDGISEYNELIEGKLRNNKLFLAVKRSFNDRPVTKRVRPTPLLEKKADT